LTLFGRFFFNKNLKGVQRKGGTFCLPPLVFLLSLLPFPLFFYPPTPNAAEGKERKERKEGKERKTEKGTWKKEKGRRKRINNFTKSQKQEPSYKINPTKAQAGLGRRLILRKANRDGF